MIRGNAFSVETIFFSVSTVFIPEWTWKIFVDVISVEHSEKDKYTDLCERELL